MPTAKTECTELSVVFGLLNRDPLSTQPDSLSVLFQGALAPAKFASFLNEYQSDTNKYTKFYHLGLALGDNHPHLHNISNLCWSGPEQQAATTALPRDLEAANSTQ